MTPVIEPTRDLPYAAARLLFYTEPTDRALIGWQPFSGSGWESIGGWEQATRAEGSAIARAVNR